MPWTISMVSRVAGRERRMLAAGRRAGQESRQHFVEAVEVQVELDMNEAFAQGGLFARIPDERVAVGRGVRDVDVHVELDFFGDQRTIEPGSGGEFVPQ